MRVSFSKTELAREAVGVLEGYGYRATQVGPDVVVTDCPALLTIPALANRFGLAAVASFDLSNKRAPLKPLQADVADFPDVPNLSIERAMVDARMSRGAAA